MKLHIGNMPNGKEVALDLETLMETRLLIQANSGGGKSYLLRRLAEQAFGKIPVIIIDPEGEFATLREKFGFVLVGEGGETPADPRSAALVAETLLKLRASAVCDLFEAFRKDPSGRHRWLKAFLEAFIEAPKSLWRDTLVIIDEAQIFCPQDGDPECKKTMISFNTVGRKRGFCPIWATQRLALVDKDASSQLLNRIVGMTFEDVDVKRAVSLLSVASEDVKEFSRDIRTLDQGNFYAFGRAISKERILFKGGPIQTSHPKRGARKAMEGPPPAPEEVRQLLPQLADLPKQAEEKARTEADLRAEVRSLKAQLKAQPTIEKPVIDTTAIRELQGQLREAERLLKQRESIYKKFHDQVTNTIRQLSGFTMEIPALPDTAAPLPDLKLNKQSALSYQPAKPVVRENRTTESTSPNGLSHPERRILTVLAQRPEGVELDRLAILSGYTVNGHFSNKLGGLRTKELVTAARVNPIQITHTGLQELGAFEPLPIGEDLRHYWLQRLSEPEGRILSVLFQQYPEEISIEELAAKAGYTVNGHFSNKVGSLRTKGLMTPARAPIRAADDFFD